MNGTGWVSYGTLGSGVGNFNYPCGITLDSSNKIYIADTSNHRIVRIDDMNGTGWVSYGTLGSGVGNFNYPCGITLDSSNKIYIADTYNHRIVRIDDMNGTGWVSYGTYGSGVGNFYYPSGITLDSSNKIYITDQYNHRIVRIDDMNGTGWVSYGTLGSGVGNFNQPWSITLDSSNKIYITDHYNHRIVRIDDMNGTGWVTYGSSGSGVGNFKYPSGITLDSSNKIYIADYYNHRIVRIDDMSGTNWINYGMLYNIINDSFYYSGTPSSGYYMSGKYDQYSLSATTNEVYEGIQTIAIPVVASTSYSLRFWYRLASSSDMQVRVYDISNSSNILTSPTFTDTSWTEYKTTFKTPAGCSKLTLKFESATDPSSTLYIDQVSLYKNLALNGGMEGTYVGGVAPNWTKQGTPTVTEFADPHTGSKAQSVLSGDTSNNIYQDITVEDNTWYTLEGYVKSNGTDFSAIELTCGLGGVYISTTLPSYTQINYTFKTSATTVKIELYNNGSATGLFDDISLTKLNSFSPVTSTSSSEVNSHFTDKFGTLSDSVLIDGSDTLSYSTVGNVSNSKGTISFWFKPLLPYNKFSENKYLLDCEDAADQLVRAYYNYSDCKYYLQFFNGTNWTTVQAISSAQNFNKDTWQHILFTYDNASGINLYVNGLEDGSYSGSWTAQDLPTDLYVGSLYNSSGNTNQADSFFDDLAIYDYILNSTEISNLYSRSTDLGKYTSLTPATLISSVYDTTSLVSDYNFVGFLNELASYSIPTSNESITIEIRSGDSPTPDFTWTSWNTVVSGLDPTIEDNNQYIQYRLTFNSVTEDNTPQVNDFTIGYLLSPSSFPQPPPKEEPKPPPEDQDSDGLPDTWEEENNLNPNDPSDADLDNDNDGLTNKEEYEYNTNPNSKDTDNDGYTDKVEIQHGTDPNDPEDNPHDICLQYYKNFKVNPLCRMKEVEEQIETRISNKLQEIIKEFFQLK